MESYDATNKESPAKVISIIVVPTHCVSCALTISSGSTRSAPDSSMHLSSLSFLLSNFAGVFSEPRAPAPRASAAASERVLTHFDDDMIFAAGRNAGDIATDLSSASHDIGDRNAGEREEESRPPRESRAPSPGIRIHRGTKGGPKRVAIGLFRVLGHPPFASPIDRLSRLLAPERTVLRKGTGCTKNLVAVAPPCRGTARLPRVALPPHVAHPSLEITCARMWGNNPRHTCVRGCARGGCERARNSPDRVDRGRRIDRHAVSGCFAVARTDYIADESHLRASEQLCAFPKKMWHTTQPRDIPSDRVPFGTLGS